jgi:hypothetical protein
MRSQDVIGDAAAQRTRCAGDTHDCHEDSLVCFVEA